MMTSGGRRQPGPFAGRPAKTDARNGSPEPDLRLAAAPKPQVRGVGEVPGAVSAPASHGIGGCVCDPPYPPAPIGGQPAVWKVSDG